MEIAFRTSFERPEWFKEMVAYYYEGYFLHWSGSYLRLIPLDYMKIVHNLRLEI